MVVGQVTANCRKLLVEYIIQGRNFLTRRRRKPVCDRGDRRIKLLVDLFSLWLTALALMLLQVRLFAARHARTNVGLKAPLRHLFRKVVLRVESDRVAILLRTLTLKHTTSATNFKAKLYNGAQPIVTSNSNE